MRVIDAHCDVLSKMLMDPSLNLEDDSRLDVTLPRMKSANTLMQSFAIYLPEKNDIPLFEAILRSIDLFHARIANHPDFHFIRFRNDLDIIQKEGKIGALLTLEGADGLQGNSMYLRILYQLGVRSIGITWNYANWAADGAMEPRQGGLTAKGSKFVKECNQLGILLDVSHLSEKSFWDMMELTRQPLLASHSNVYEVCPHPRNLKNGQIEAIIKCDGRMGVTFVPWFVQTSGPVTITHLLSHIDHVCSLGGVRHLGFGSDFDGIHQWIQGLEHPGKYPDLISILCKYYKDEEVEGFLWRNWFDYYRKNLPDSPD